MVKIVAENLVKVLINGRETQGWHIFAFDKGQISQAQAFPIGGVPGVRLQTRVNDWRRLLTAEGFGGVGRAATKKDRHPAEGERFVSKWWWVLDVEVENLDTDSAVYELWISWINP